MKDFYVKGEWKISAESKEAALNIVENAVAATPQCVELVDSDSMDADEADFSIAEPVNDEPF